MMWSNTKSHVHCKVKQKSQMKVKERSEAKYRSLGQLWGHRVNNWSLEITDLGQFGTVVLNSHKKITLFHMGPLVFGLSPCIHFALCFDSDQSTPKRQDSKRKMAITGQTQQGHGTQNKTKGKQVLPQMLTGHFGLEVGIWKTQNTNGYKSLAKNNSGSKKLKSKYELGPRPKAEERRCVWVSASYVQDLCCHFWLWKGALVPAVLKAFRCGAKDLSQGGHRFTIPRCDTSIHCLSANTKLEKGDQWGFHINSQSFSFSHHWTNKHYKFTKLLAFVTKRIRMMKILSFVKNLVLCSL